MDGKTVLRSLHGHPGRAPSNGVAARPLLRFLACAAALSMLTACEFMQYFGGEGSLATAIERPAAVPEGPTEEEIRSAQKALAGLGYRPGPADGELGARTEQAVRDYQKRAGLPVDGEISQALLDSLSRNPVRAPAPPPSPVEMAGQPEAEQENPVSDNDVVVIPIPEDLLPPLYEAGDVFAWSDGHFDTVYRVSADKVFWRTSGKTSYNKDPNFMFPPSSWDGKEGPGSAMVAVERGESWPRQEGGELVLDLAFKVTPTTALDSPVGWQCSLGGERKVIVPAGEFDTRAFTCRREGAPAGEWISRTWFYAPAVRHFVRRIDEFGDGARRSVSLVAMRPSGKNWPAAARVGFEWAIQDALDKQANGDVVEWGSTGVQDKFRIMPTKNHLEVSGNLKCRSFVLERGTADTQRTYPAIACQDSESGNWLVPVLDKDAIPVIALQGTS